MDSVAPPMGAESTMKSNFRKISKFSKLLEVESRGEGKIRPILTPAAMLVLAMGVTSSLEAPPEELGHKLPEKIE